MAQHYSDRNRETDPHALPNVETFYLTDREMRSDDEHASAEPEYYVSGWYYWFCFPGCLPDSDPIGPFETEADALADARSDADTAAFYYDDPND